MHIKLCMKIVNIEAQLYMEIPCVNETNCTPGVMICFHDLSACESPRERSDGIRKHSLPSSASNHPAQRY